MPNHVETLPVKGRWFKAWLHKTFYDRHRKSPPGDALKSVIELMESKALFGPNVQEVHIRVAEHGGNIYIDLCNDKWQVVEVTAEGWRIITDAPVRYRRSPNMLALPIPQRDGSIDGLRKFLNVDDDAWTLIAAWLVSALRTSGPKPIALLSGEQGSGKSTKAHTLRALVDPNVAPLRSLPKNTHDLMIAAKNGWCSVFDNLSGISQSFSDALCRLSTGGGFATRELYTDLGETIIQAKRPLILTSIGQTVTKPDLLERCVLIHLPPMADTQRLPESEYWAEFEAMAPQIFGGLLDAMSQGLANEGNVQVATLPRMADYAKWAVACEPGLGLAPGAFMAAYDLNRDSANRYALDASPIVKPLMELADEKGLYEGTATELLTALSDRAGNAVAGKDWPRTAKTLAMELQTISPLLRPKGYFIDQRQTSGSKSQKLWTISKRAV